MLKVYEILKKNQYGQYLKDVLDGKYLDVLALTQSLFTDLYKRICSQVSDISEFSNSYLIYHPPCSKADNFICLTL